MVAGVGGADFKVRTGAPPNYRLVVCRDDWDPIDWECVYYDDLERAVQGAEKLLQQEGCPRLEIQDIAKEITVRVFEPKSSN